MSNTYQVTMHRIQQHTFTVEADTQEEAEHKANNEARINGIPDSGYANWETIHTLQVVVPA